MKGIFFCDVDGTLVPNGASTAPQSLLDLMASTEEQGYLMCVNTGRMYHAVRHVFGQVEQKVLFACSNGSRLFVHGKEDPSYRRFFPQVLVVTLSRICAEYGCAIAVSADETLYLLGYVEPDMMDFLHSQCNPTQEIADASELLGKHVWQITILLPVSCKVDPGLVVALRGAGVQVAPSGGRLIDISPSNKSHAVQELLTMYSIPQERSYGFGDAENDTAMLSAVGNPFVMENGSPVMKQRFPNHVSDIEVAIRDIVTKG